MIARYRGGALTAVPADDSPVGALLEPLGSDVAAALDAFDLTGALERIWEVVRALNRHVEATAPWQLAKDEARSDELDRVLYDLADGLRAVAVVLAAYLPGTSERILEALGQPTGVAWDEVGYGRTQPVDGLEAAPPLFPRVDEPATAA
jgi:methionyl-tRNA synthetase